MFVGRQCRRQRKAIVDDAFSGSTSIEKRHSVRNVDVAGPREDALQGEKDFGRNPKMRAMCPESASLARGTLR